MNEKAVPIRIKSMSLQPLLAEVTGRIEDQRFLADVVKQLKSEGRTASLIEVINQDEFTHDVIVRFRNEVHLVYDTN